MTTTTTPTTATATATATAPTTTPPTTPTPATTVTPKLTPAATAHPVAPPEGPLLKNINLQARDAHTVTVPITNAIKIMFATSTQAFDVAVYQPTVKPVTVPYSDFGGELNVDRAEIVYGVPAMARAIEITDEATREGYLDSGAGGDDAEKEPILVLLDMPAKKSSVIHWEELEGYDAKNAPVIKTVLRYVLEIQTTDRNGITMPKYKLIPFGGAAEGLPAMIPIVKIPVAAAPGTSKPVAPAATTGTIPASAAKAPGA